MHNAAMGLLSMQH